VHRKAVRLTADGIERDVALGAVSAALPVLAYDPTSKTILGVATPSGGGSSGGISLGAVIEQTSNYVVPSASLTDVTGFNLAVSSSGTFWLDLVVYVSQATAGSVNGLAINYTGAVTRINLAANFPATLTTANLVRQTANNTAMTAPSMSAGVTIPVRISGTLVVSTVGTLSLRAQSAAGVTTVLQGSGGVVVEQLGSGSPAPTPTSVFQPLTVMAIENPMNHGAVGNGSTDDLTALQNTVAALPAAGGAIYFPSGKTFKKTNVWAYTKNHVKLWAQNTVGGGSTIFGSIVSNTQGRQATKITGATGAGVHGVKFTSDASTRYTAYEDNQVSYLNCVGPVESCGVEVNGGACVGLFMSGCTETYTEGNYVHLTWADEIHHTGACNGITAWDNWIYNVTPSLGDDGIAVVTYNHTSTVTQNGEIWNNTVLQTDWGRCFSCIGGANIEWHHNYGINGAGAGIIVAEEPPGVDSPASHDLSIHDNVFSGNGRFIGHPNMIVSGQNDPPAGPIYNVAFVNNTCWNDTNGNYGTNGSVAGTVTNTGMSTTPVTLPTLANVAIRDTAIMRTRDISHVSAAFQPGLYRIHVTTFDGGVTFKQRFEYVVKGLPADVASFISTRVAAGDYASTQVTVSGTVYVVMLMQAPLTIPGTLTGVTFQDLRTGDKNGTLSALWTTVNTGSY
jgi:hypothetical protein